MVLTYPAAEGQPVLAVLSGRHRERGEGLAGWAGALARFAGAALVDAVPKPERDSHVAHRSIVVPGPHVGEGERRAAKLGAAPLPAFAHIVDRERHVAKVDEDVVAPEFAFGVVSPPRVVARPWVRLRVRRQLHFDVDDEARHS
eukprot:1811771-Prymnesium_polylepis.2